MLQPIKGDEEMGFPFSAQIADTEMIISHYAVGSGCLKWSRQESMPQDDLRLSKAAMVYEKSI
ncbi:MAG: hypothetical protein M3146_04980 [Thermoproteota archaeon]|nr:hypothetical protein [Thermoproteota archaeon]